MRFLVVLLSLWTVEAMKSSYTYPPSVTLKDKQIFDYIVVGAGASGSAAAARLALAGNEVLLVEAGDDPNILSKIPSTAMGLLGSNIDWKYKTIPNNVSCLSSEGKQCRFSRGKCLGGSTSINYMLYTRGNRRDYDSINVKDWSWKDLEPYFLKYEGLTDFEKLPETSRHHHNTSGIMKLGFFEDPENPWQERLMNSFKSLGFPLNHDVNGDSQIGISKVLGYVHKRERMSTARAYLSEDKVKKRLKVAKETLCTGVISSKNNIVRGIIAVQDMRKLRLYAKKEVIISAGAIGTPQILMLSGIGPVDHLQRMGIKVKANLPVGENMSDHILPLLIMLVDKTTGVEHEIRHLSNKTEHISRLLMDNEGPLTSNGLTDVNLFANTRCYDFKNQRLLDKSLDGSDCEVPNLQVIHAYIDRKFVSIAKPLFKNAIGLNDNVVNQISEANRDHAVIVISPIVLDPYSRGWVKLASPNPWVPPAIFPNYLSDSRDLDNMIEAIRLIEGLEKSEVFRSNSARLLHLSLPGCPDFSSDREGYWRCYCRHMTFAVYHAAGTCALDRVVDNRLRVLGMSNLRVADLSVMPVVPHGNTAAISIAIGERVADFVMEDNKRDD